MNNKETGNAKARREPPDLSTLRAGRGLSLERIAQDTKISVGYLRSIEAGDFERLPGGIYSTSYIRQYARAIDFPEADLLACYYSKMGIDPESQGGAGDREKTEGKSTVKGLPALLRSL